MPREELLCLIGSRNYWIRTRVIDSNIERDKFYLPRNLLVFPGGLGKSLDLVDNVNDIAGRQESWCWRARGWEGCSRRDSRVRSDRSQLDVAVEGFPRIDLGKTLMTEAQQDDVQRRSLLLQGLMLMLVWWTLNLLVGNRMMLASNQSVVIICYD